MALVDVSVAWCVRRYVDYGDMGLNIAFCRFDRAQLLRYFLGVWSRHKMLVESALFEEA